MKQEALGQFSDVYLVVIALAIFMIFFTALIVWVYSKSNKEHFEKMSKIPLNEGGEE